MAKDSREIGQEAENAAKAFLQNHKLKFIESNYHSRFGEIDLIFIDPHQKPSQLLFVEVKYRDKLRHGTGAESVTPAKQRKLLKTAQIFLQKEIKYSPFSARFDVVSVTKENQQWQFDWFKNAFQPNPW